MSRFAETSARLGAFAVVLLLVAGWTAVPRHAWAQEAAAVDRAYRAGVGRASYGIAMTTLGFAMVPATTESILAGRLRGKEAGGYFLSAALLGFGGIPFIANALRPLSNDPLAGPRARLRFAEKGALTYAILGCMFGSIGMITTAVVGARHEHVPPDLVVFNVSSAWLLCTAIGLAADGDLARRQIHGPGSSETLLDLIGGPMLGYGIVLLTLATPALRLCLDKDGLPLEPTLFPLIGGVVYFAAGMICVVAAKASKLRSQLASRQARVGVDLIIDPVADTYGLAFSGRF